MQRDYVPLFRSICTSEKFAALRNDGERLLYLLLLTQCDSWGRCEDSPATLNALCWPLLGRKPKDVDLALISLHQSGLLRRLTDNSMHWIQITGWEDRAGRIGHPDRRGASRWPSEGLSGPLRTTPDSAGPIPSEQSRAEESRAEERREEQNRADTPPSPPGGKRAPRAPATGPNAELIRFWEAEWLQTRGTPYVVEAKDGVAVAGILKMACGDLQEAQRRAERLLRSSDAWMTQNASLGLLRSRWNQLAVDVVQARKNEPKGVQGIREYFGMNGGSHEGS